MGLPLLLPYNNNNNNNVTYKALIHADMQQMRSVTCQCQIEMLSVSSLRYSGICLRLMRLNDT